MTDEKPGIFKVQKEPQERNFSSLVLEEQKLLQDKFDEKSKNVKSVLFQDVDRRLEAYKAF